MGYVRIVFLLLLALTGASCATWGWFVLPIFAQQHNIQRLATRVIDGQSFPTEILENILPPALHSSYGCQASVLKATAIVRLRLTEVANELAARELISEMQRSLRGSVRDAISCSPTEPFLWLLQYWLEVTQNGFNDRALAYLRMSYAVGPNEGWVSVKRNGFSLAIYDRLPEDLAALIVPEFLSLVRSGFYSEAASNLAGPGWQMREALVAALASVEEKRRHEFAKYLRARGLYLDVPGLDSVPRRPWN